MSAANVSRKPLAALFLALLALISSAALATSEQADARSRSAVTDSAQSYAAASLSAIAPVPDQIHLVERHIRISTFHLADRDHVGPPYATDYGDATTTDDERADRQVRSVNLALATGAATEQRTVTIARTSVTSTMRNGKALGSSRAGMASPAWWTQDPLRLLLRAAAAEDARFVGELPVHGVPARQIQFTDGGLSVTVSIAKGNLLPLAVETIVTLPADIAWGSRGDISERTEWQNWTMSSGIRLPFQTDVFRNGEPLMSSSIASVTFDPVAPSGFFEQDAAAIALLDAPGARDVDSLPLGRPDRPAKEIAPGVLQIPGPWYTMAVLQPDGVVVIDAPISTGYSEQAIAEIERRFPGKPIKAVVTTTSFNWHTAGLRAYAARGVPIYALDRNMGVVDTLLRAPHRLRPDELSLRSRRPIVRSVSKPMVLGTGATRITLYPIAHATSPMLMAYFPELQLLHTAETIQPLGPGGVMIFPESLREIVDEVAARKIDVRTVVGMHMDPTPWSTVLRSLRAAS